MTRGRSSHNASTSRRHRTPPSSLRDDDDFDPSPPDYKPIDTKRRLERTQGFHPDIILKRPRIERDLRDEPDRGNGRSRDGGRERERPSRRNRSRYQDSSETETDDMDPVARKTQFTYNRDHDWDYDNRRNARHRSARKFRKSIDLDTTLVEDDGNLAALQLMKTLSESEIKEVLKMTPEQLQAFIYLRQAGNGLKGTAAGCDSPHVLANPQIPARCVKAEGLVDMSDEDSQEMLTGTNVELYLRGRQICDDLEDALTKMATSCASPEPANDEILLNFKPIAKAFSGEKIGQQFGMWMDHQSLSRKKLETAFADAQNKLNNIHTRAAEAVALIQPAIDNQKRLVEKARTDFTALFARQVDELKELREEIAPLEAKFREEIKRIPEEKELKKAAKKQVMELMWDD